MSGTASGDYFKVRHPDGLTPERLKLVYAIPSISNISDTPDENAKIICIAAHAKARMTIERIFNKLRKQGFEILYHGGIVMHIFSKGEP